MTAADNRCVLGFILSGGEASDAGNGRLLLDAVGRMKDPDEEGPLFLLMDWAYEGRETQRPVFEWGYSLVVPGEEEPEGTLGIRQGVV